MYSAEKLNKQGDNIEPWLYSFPNFEPVYCSMSSSNCCFYIQLSQEAGKMVWYSHFFKNFPQFVVIHTVKGFSVVNEAEINVFLELLCLAVWSLIPLCLWKPVCTSGISLFIYCWSLAWRILCITLLADALASVPSIHLYFFYLFQEHLQTQNKIILLHVLYLILLKWVLFNWCKWTWRTESRLFGQWELTQGKIFYDYCIVNWMAFKGNYAKLLC